MTKPKILVVEDERVVATDIEDCLKKLGYAVIGEAATGLNAIRRAVETEPDLVLMDIKLKGKMDGIDAARELHDRLGIPVVFLTAYADGAILDRAKKSAPSGYVLKPFDERALRSAVEIALDRHPKEKKLEDSERRLVTAFRTLGEAVILTDHEGRVTFLNRTAEKLTGWSHGEAAGKRVRDVFTTLDARMGALKGDPVMRVLTEGSVLGLGDDAVLISRNGSESMIQGEATPLRDDDNEIVGVALVFESAGSGSETTYELNRQTCNCRMETLGRLTKTLSSEMNVMLAKVSGFLGRLRKSKVSRTVLQKELDELSSEVEGARELAELAMSFASPSRAEPKAVELNGVLQRLERLIECAAGAKVGVQFSPRKTAGHVHVDVHQLEKLLLDAVIECCRRMPKGGRVLIETDCVRLLGEYARSRTSLSEGLYSLLSVSYAAAVMTPPPGEPKLELSPLYESVRKMGGDMSVQAEPGRITTLDIYLPMVLKETDAD